MFIVLSKKDVCGHPFLFDAYGNYQIKTSRINSHFIAFKASNFNIVTFHY
jgi:hypothetical protein